MGADQANSLIRRVFEERFGPNKVICVKTIRKTDNIQTLFKERDIFTKRLEYY